MPLASTRNTSSPGPAWGGGLLEAHVAVPVVDGGAHPLAPLLREVDLVGLLDVRSLVHDRADRADHPTGQSDWKMLRPMSTPRAPCRIAFQASSIAFALGKLLAAGDHDGDGGAPDDLLEPSQ